MKDGISLKEIEEGEKIKQKTSILFPHPL